jgi:hypothetical protein
MRTIMSRRQRIASIAQWAGLIGLADDARSLAAARTLIAQGDGPEVVPVRRRKRTDSGVRLSDHERWARTKEWVKFLAADAAKNGRK